MTGRIKGDGPGQLRDAGAKAKLLGEYGRYTARKYNFILAMSLVLVLTALVSVKFGSVPLGYQDIAVVLGKKIFNIGCPSSDIAMTVVWELRLPRICMGIVVGAGLALAGVVMQVVLRNPLASPYTLGMASAAGFGAALSFVLNLGVGRGSELWTVTNAFVFSLLSSMLVIGLARLRQVSSGTLILAGIAMMFLFSALTSLLQYLGSNEEIAAVVFWLMGNLSRSTWPRVALTSAAVLGILPVLLRYSWDYNSLAAGDETARSFGVNIGRVRFISLALASLIVASAICFVGTIAFVGLVAPHITRMIIGNDHRFLLPASGLFGAVLLLGADTAARTVLSPVVLPVGILTSFLGVPLFVYLIIKKRREYL